VKEFRALSFDDTVSFINETIYTFNSKNKIDGRVIFNPIYKFPIYYRPTPSMYNLISNSPKQPDPEPVYNSQYFSIGYKFCFAGTCNLEIRIVSVTTSDIKSAKSCSGPENTINTVYDCVVGKINEDLKNQNILNVLLPTLNQMTNPETTVFAPTPSNNNNTKTKEQDIYMLVNRVFGKIRLNSSAEKFGYGLIYAEDKVGKPYKIKKSSQDIYKFNGTPITMGSLAADKVFLLSQKSEIPGKGGINFDGTLYGITNEQYVQEIIPKTSSMVRGEELLELINMIVRFLTSHTHAFPGMPPVPVAYDGSNVTSILTELQNATNKILNENIRLN
jgi:hypothetical protein